MERPNKPGILCTVQVLKVSLLPWSRDRRVTAALGLRDLCGGGRVGAVLGGYTRVCSCEHSPSRAPNCVLSCVKFAWKEARDLRRRLSRGAAPQLFRMKWM